MIHDNGLKTLLVLFFVLMPSAAPAEVGLSGHWTIRMMPDFKGNQTVEKCLIQTHGHQLCVRFGTDGAELAGIVDGRHAEWHWQNDKTQVAFTADAGATWKTMRGAWRL